jgi:hypothetical protein
VVLIALCIIMLGTEARLSAPTIFAKCNLPHLLLLRR